MAKSKLIQVRIPEDLAKKLDELSEAGWYQNRSEVIVDAIRHLIAAVSGEDETWRLTVKNLAGKVEKTSFVDELDSAIDSEEIRRVLCETYGTDDPLEIIEMVRR